MEDLVRCMYLIDWPDPALVLGHLKVQRFAGCESTAPVIPGVSICGTSFDIIFLSTLLTAVLTSNRQVAMCRMPAAFFVFTIHNFTMIAVCFFLCERHGYEPTLLSYRLVVLIRVATPQDPWSIPK